VTRESFAEDHRFQLADLTKDRFHEKSPETSYGPFALDLSRSFAHHRGEIEHPFVVEAWVNHELDPNRVYDANVGQNHVDIFVLEFDRAYD